MDVLIAPRTGLRLINPVMAASGTFGYGVEFAARMDLSGLGAIVCKGTTREPRAGNPPVRVTETAAGMLNAIGLQNIGVEAVISRMAPRWKHLGTPVLVNVAGTTVDDYRYVVERLDTVDGVSGIELNISCPNVKEGGVLFGTDPRLAAQVTAAVRQATQRPLLVKLSPNVSDIRAIARAVEEAGADAISVANTLYGMAIDVRRRRPVLANITGGLSGPAIKPYALYLVYEVANAVSVPVIGVGGVMSGRDAAEFLLAGASAVQLGTALMIDPTSWQRVVIELNDWLRQQRAPTVGDVVGAAHPEAKQNAGEQSLAG
jgi:dihydroorotate dehydrogenase (NAD+) catalytic subunit